MTNRFSALSAGRIAVADLGRRSRGGVDALTERSPGPPVGWPDPFLPDLTSVSVMTSRSRPPQSRPGRSGAALALRGRSGLPWLTIVAVVVILGLVVAVFTYIYSKQRARSTSAAAEAAAAEVLKPWQPSPTNMDPSIAIPGIYVGQTVNDGTTITFPNYRAALHVTSAQRVAYDRFPPVGGPHDAEWAACNGVVYSSAVRDENMVHTLEHGAVWIAYNPATLAPGDLDTLKALVVGKTYLSLSPYPTLDQPIALQAWGHQLKLSSAADPRVRQFITALQANRYITPEPNGSCDQPDFLTRLPPFDPAPRGSDAIPLSGAGLVGATAEMGAPGR